MSFEIKELKVQSSDNIHTLTGLLYIPEGEIKGLLHIVHGMTEHIERYDHLAAFAAENGFLAFGYDHLGHGKTAKDEAELGFIAHRDGWKYLVNDVGVFEKAVKRLYPNLPLYLFGHSMGSFIVRLAAESFGEELDKLIICGTGGKNSLTGVGLLLIKLIKFLKGEKHISDTVHKMAFGTYNKGLPDTTDYEWLTKDREVIEKYSKDKFCTFRFTVSAMEDLLRLTDHCNRKDWYKRIPKTLPIFLIAGDKDPVGSYGKGVTEVYQKLKRENINAQIKLYPDCRHEILNDSCKGEVLCDIISFIKE